MRNRTKGNKMKFDAHGYVLAAGWDFTCIEDTARLGVSVTDAEGLTGAEQDALYAYCRSRVEEARATTSNEKEAE